LDVLNPVTRLVCALLLAVPVLITLDWVSATVMLALELAVFRWMGVKLVTMVHRLLPVLVIGLLVAISMVLYGRPGGHVFWQWWLIEVSERSLLMSLAVFWRVLALALAAIVLLGDVDPTLMADGLAQGLRLPARFVLGTLAGVRMLGLMTTDWRALGQARRARGLGDRGWLRRFASMAFALLVIAIRRGTQLATAMEVRGFGTAKQRTWARQSHWGTPDAIGLVLTLLADAASLVAAIWAGTFWLIWSSAST